MVLNKVIEKERVIKRVKRGVDGLVHKTRSAGRIPARMLQNLGLGFWIFVVIMFVIAYVFIFYLENVTNLIVQEYGYAGIFALSFILDLIVQPLAPDIPLIFGLVMHGLNPLFVLLSVLAGCYLALFVAYYLGKSIGAPGIEKIVGQKTFEKIKKHPSYGKWILFIGALTPIPYIPYLAGLWELDFKDVMIYAVLPRTIRFIIVFIFTYFFGIQMVNYFFPG